MLFLNTVVSVFVSHAVTTPFLAAAASLVMMAFGFSFVPVFTLMASMMLAMDLVRAIAAGAGVTFANRQMKEVA